MGYAVRSSLKSILSFLIYIAVAIVPSASAKTTVKAQGDISVTDDPYAFSINMLAQLDNAWYSGSTYDKQGQFPNGGSLRRIYLYFKGTLTNDWSFIFIPRTVSGVSHLPVDDLVFLMGETYLSYNGFKNTHLQFGQFSIPTSLEKWTGYADDLFIGRSLPVGTFFPVYDYGIGIYADHTFSDTFLLQGAFFQPPAYIVANGQVGLGNSDRVNGAMRLTMSPWHREDCAIHFGVWGRYQSYYSSFMGAPVPLAFAFRGYNSNPEMHGRITGALINTGPLRNKSHFLSGIEFATVSGPWLIQAEYMGVGVRQAFSNRNPGQPLNNNLWFSGWYIESSYVLTGESYHYKFASGLFHRPSPQCWYGAFEIIARYSTVNLTDKNISGGKEHDLSLGLNWYVNTIVRVSANYVHATANPTLQNPSLDNRGKRKLDVFGVRLQLKF